MKSSRIWLLLSLAVFCQSFATWAQTLEFKFTWPDTGCIKVAENVVNMVGQSDLTYQLCWKSTTHQAEPAFRVSIKKLKYKKLNGAKPDPKLAKFSDRQAPPSFLVSKNTGKFLDVDRKALSAFILNMKNIPQKNAKDMGPVTKIMAENPAILNELSATASKPWKAWVGLWVGTFDLGKNTLKNGTSIEVTQQPNHLFLFKHQEDISEEFKNSMTTILGGIGMSAKLNMLQVESATRSYETTTNANLRPIRSHWEQQTVLKIASTKKEDSESHDYTFNWDGVE